MYRSVNNFFFIAKLLVTVVFYNSNINWIYVCWTYAVKLFKSINSLTSEFNQMYLLFNVCDICVRILFPFLKIVQNKFIKNKD